MKCSECRQHDVLDTRWERIKRWALYKMFPDQVIDFNQERYTQGFGDGYKRGFAHGNEIKPLMTAEDMIDMYDELPEATPVKLMKNLPSKKEIKHAKKTKRPSVQVRSRKR